MFPIPKGYFLLTALFIALGFIFQWNDVNLDYQEEASIEYVRRKGVNPNATSIHDHRRPAPITHSSSESFHSSKSSSSPATSSSSSSSSTNPINDGYNDKQPLIDILLQAQADFTPFQINSLPTWTDITSTYGNEPKIKGLITCENYQATIPPSQRLIAPTGLPHSGTNLLAELLQSYCIIPERYNLRKNDTKFQTQKMFKTTGMMKQVPWGSDKPLDLRSQVVEKMYFNNVKYDRVLPIVVISHPFSWMRAMCRHPPTNIDWTVDTKHHCPNLIPTPHDLKHHPSLQPNQPIPITYKLSNHNKHSKYKYTETRHYPSLIDLWNEWYHPYYQEDSFPRLIVRAEDLIFSTEQVVTQVCQCAGGKVREELGPVGLEEDLGMDGVVNFKSQQKNVVVDVDDNVGVGEDDYLGHEQGKAQDSPLIAMLKEYGHPFHWKENTMTNEDVEYAQETLQNDIMTYFGYKIPNE